MIERMFDFTAVAICFFFLAFTVLGVLGFLPSDLQKALNSRPVFQFSSAASVVSAASAQGQVGQSGQFAPIKYTPDGTKEYPVQIKIPAISVNASVLNPKNADVSVLDQDLTEGAVRYPTSGALNDGSNVFLFGHSSYLKIVHNKAYRTFDGLQNLQKGDEIEVDGAQNAYFYAVTSVVMVKDTEAGVDVGGKDHLLILSTCDTFGAKEDRFVVTAQFLYASQISTPVPVSDNYFNN